MRAEMPQTLGITLTNDAGSLKADANWRLNPAIASQIQLQASLIAVRSPAAPRFVLASFHAGAEGASSIWVLRQAISPATAAEQRRIFALPDSSPGTPAKGILRLSVDAY